MSERREVSADPSHTDVCLWLDYYGELLSERQREILTLYFNEDWSLSEIAEETGLSRQGVHDQIRRAVARLEDLESALLLSVRDQEIETLILSALASNEKGDREALRRSLYKLLETIRPAGEEAEYEGRTHGLI